jgi:hypothetical protein
MSSILEQLKISVSSIYDYQTEKAVEAHLAPPLASICDLLGGALFSGQQTCPLPLESLEMCKIAFDARDGDILGWGVYVSSEAGKPFSSPISASSMRPDFHDQLEALVRASVAELPAAVTEIYHVDYQASLTGISNHTKLQLIALTGALHDA